MRCQVIVSEYQAKRSTKKYIENTLRSYAKRKKTWHQWKCAAVSVATEVRGRHDSNSDFVNRWRWGHVSGEVLATEELCLESKELLRVVTDEEKPLVEESPFPVTAALSQIDAGEALLVREVGVALLFLYSLEGGICVSAVLASSVLSTLSK